MKTITIEISDPANPNIKLFREIGLQDNQLPTEYQSQGLQDMVDTLYEKENNI